MHTALLLEFALLIGAEAWLEAKPNLVTRTRHHDVITEFAGIDDNNLQLAGLQEEQDAVQQPHRRQAVWPVGRNDEVVAVNSVLRCCVGLKLTSRDYRPKNKPRICTSKCRQPAAPTAAKLLHLER